MNTLRTAMLLAAMTALFMGVGYLIGGSGGMVIALLIAAAMNLFSYWNADKMVLSMNRAVEVDERNAPEYYAIVQSLARQAGLPVATRRMPRSPPPPDCCSNFRMRRSRLSWRTSSPMCSTATR